MAMGRKPNFTLDENTFPNRLKNLMRTRDVTQQLLADYLQVTRQTVSYYSSGSSSPDWETLVKISDFFSVSTDYLLGKVKNPTPNQDIQAICQYTGLSDQSVALLHHEQASEGPQIAQLIDSVLFTSNCISFDSAHLELLSELLRSGSRVDDSILGVLLHLQEAKNRYKQRNVQYSDESKTEIAAAKETLSANGLLAISADEAYEYSIERAVADFRNIITRIVEQK